MACPTFSLCCFLLHCSPVPKTVKNFLGQPARIGRRLAVDPKQLLALHVGFAGHAPYKQGPFFLRRESPLEDLS